MAEGFDLADDLAVLERELKSARAELEKSRDIVLRLEGARNFVLSMLHRMREEEKKQREADEAALSALPPKPAKPSKATPKSSAAVGPEKADADSKIIPIGVGKKED